MRETDLETLIPYKFSDLFKSKRVGGDKGHAEKVKTKNRRRNKLSRANRKHNLKTGHVAGKQ